MICRMPISDFPNYEDQRMYPKTCDCLSFVCYVCMQMKLASNVWLKAKHQHKLVKQEMFERCVFCFVPIALRAGLPREIRREILEAMEVYNMTFKRAAWHFNYLAFYHDNIVLSTREVELPDEGLMPDLVTDVWQLTHLPTTPTILRLFHEVRAFPWNPRRFGWRDDGADPEVRLTPEQFERQEKQIAKGEEVDLGSEPDSDQDYVLVGQEEEEGEGNNNNIEFINEDEEVVEEIDNNRSSDDDYIP